MKRDRWQISVRGEVYDKIKRVAGAHGVSVCDVVEAALDGAMDAPLVKPEDVDRLAPAGPLERLDPTHFFCASCGGEQWGMPYLLPWGKDKAKVRVCATCVEEHPRSGRYGFGGGV